MERALLNQLETVLLVVALLEDQLDVLGPCGEFAAALGRVLGEALEDGRVGTVWG